ALNTATVTLPALANANALAGNKAIVIDTTAPTIQSVSGPSGTYYRGYSVPISVKFSEPVKVITGYPLPTLSLSITNRGATYASGDGTDTLTFMYTVASGDTSADLDYAATTSLALNGGTIRDAAGNDAVLTVPAPGAVGSLSNTSAITVVDADRTDFQAPAVLGVSAGIANGSYTVGTTIPIQVTFDEPVNVTPGNGTPVTDTPSLRIVVNSQTQETRLIPYTSGSGSSVLTFNYVVQAGDTSTDLDYFSATALDENGGTIRDLAGNPDDRTTIKPPVHLGLPAPGTTDSLGANKNIVIDTVKPTFAVTYSQASFSATVSGTSLNVSTGSVVGTIAIGHVISFPGVTSGTTITGGSGLSWTLSNPHTVTQAVAMTSATAGFLAGAPAYKAGAVVLTATSTKTLPAVPTISIDQQGTTDIV
ncbi:MAG: hypothetical protein EBS94_17355, partial [Proteobacteria bacterium]|nr:hypothetical protein [Pseudomonadota bacterium]